MRSIIPFIVLLSACGVQRPDEFATSRSQQSLTIGELERRIGDPLADYMDPEYRVTGDGGLITFIDGADVVRLKAIDAEGHLVDEGTPGQALGTNGPYFRSANGPEFGVSARGQAIVWTGLDDAGVRQFFLYRDGGTTQLTHGSDDVSANLPCKDPTAPEQKILGFTMDGGAQSWFWISEQQPEVRHPVPLAEFGSSGPWWYLDSSRILTNTTVGRFAQVTLVEPDGGQRVLTSGATDKVDMLAFRAPELGGAPVLLTILKERRQSRQLAFYRVNETQPQSTPLALAPFQTDLRSPEPFVFGSTSGASLVVTGQDSNDIVLVGLDAGVTKVSGTTALARTDPETFVIGSSLYVSYYVTSRTGPIALFHTRVDR